jgi:signal transduction histidine kinase
MKGIRMKQMQILVVEDEGIIAADLQNRLERMGFAVPAVAGSGQQALLLSRQTPFDLVLMDIRLKGEMDGIQAAEALRRERNVPIVYVAAYADIKTIERAKAAGAFGYVVKPVRDSSLRAAVEISIEKHRVEQDVSGRLPRTREKCELLSGLLRAAKENEGRKRARQVHDDVQRQLTAIALDLEIQQDEAGISPEARAVLHDAGLQLRQLSRDMRRLSEDLHPQILEELGLTSALHRLCRQSGSQGLRVRFRNHRVPDSVPAAVALCLYRVAQESLRNVLMHAATTSAKVSLEGTDSGIELCIVDWGTGFDPELPTRRGSGLEKMSRRLANVGGALQLTSAQGHGARICASVPLPAAHR